MMSGDTFGRDITYLRISVTDRCNLRCIYCMPEEGVEPKEHDSILSLEEIARFVSHAADFGINRVRLTGGEPLVRLDLPDLIRDIRAIDAIEDISLTTNGALLPKYAKDLKEAGLDRVNISLDTLDPQAYRRITRRGELTDTLRAIDTALEYGFNPVKVNTVVMRSLDQDLFEFARMSVDRPLHIRFIEYMPVGCSSGIHGEGWTKDESVPSAEVVEAISTAGVAAGIGGLTPLSETRTPGGVGPARYYVFDGALGTVGVISPLSNHFCSRCNRLRLTADGKLRPCLFSDLEMDARSALRSGDPQKVKAVIKEALLKKPQSHEFKEGTERRMSQIGG